MKNSSSLRFSALLGSALLISVLSARAQTEVNLQSTTSDSTYDSQIVPGEANDLIYQQTGSLTDGLTAGTLDYGSPYNTTGPTNTGPDIDFTLAGLTDGKSTDGTDPTQCFFGTYHFDNAFSLNTFGNSLNYDPIVTYNLGSSPTGYTLSEIQSIEGYTNEESFADQNYTVQYLTVGDATWQTLATVAYNPFAPWSTDTLNVANTGSNNSVSTDVTLTNLGVTGVTEIQFDFSPYVDPSVLDADTSTLGQEQFGQVIRELQVNGVATTAVPEPSAWAMMVVGAAGVAVLSLRRRVRA